MLTNAQVREAKPRSIRYEITCDALPGFILRVLPTGKKVFFARYRDADGKDHRHRLGLMGPDLGADEARREAMAILARREVPTSADEPTPAARTAVAAPASGPKSPTSASSPCVLNRNISTCSLKARNGEPLPQLAAAVHHPGAR
jgi:hypothetical protein